MKRNLLLISTTILLLGAMACTISFGGAAPQEQPGAVETAVAQTLAASQAQQPTAVVIVPTVTQAVAPTAVLPPTATPQPCNKAVFISETIPDNSELDINDSFTKSWRVRNTGTCTWNSNYKIVFFSGDQMSGPNSKNFSGTFAPGEVMDISVPLKAPGTTGTYTGYWKLQGDDGVNFAQLYVLIKAVGPAGPVTKTVTLNAISGESGSVRSGSTVHPGLLNVGDTVSNLSSQVFLSFDISGIPSGSVINEVKLDFRGNDTLGDPFGSLGGYLRIYQQDFGSLDAGDYFGGSALGALVRWGSMAEVNTVAAIEAVRASLQSKVGSSRYQIRLQFNVVATDNNNDDDMVRFSTPKLIVIYTK